MNTTNKVEPIAPHLEPIRKSVTVACSVEKAFEIFTGRIASWWPVSQYSISQERTRNVVIEPRVGGRIYEERDDGETFPWGKVGVWEAPHRIVFSWHPGKDAETAQSVEVRFAAAEGGTHVELEHRGWARYGDGAEKARDSYAGGWDAVLGSHFAKACVA